MDADVLFLGLLEKLEHEISDEASAIDSLRAAATLRLLLIDGGGGLVARVNARYKLHVSYEAVPTTHPPLRQGRCWQAGDGIDPEGQSGGKAMKLDDFLRLVVLTNGTQTITVKALIKGVANTGGGVHFGVTGKTKADERAVSDVPPFLLKWSGGLNVDAWGLRAVGRITLRALQPLCEAAVASRQASDPSL